MSDGAPTETNIVQFPNQQTQEFQARVAKNSTEAGHPLTPAQANPEDKSALHKIQDMLGQGAHVIGEEIGVRNKDFQYATGTALEDLLGGTSLATVNSRTTNNTNVADLKEERKKRMQISTDQLKKQAA